jgi:hypothetical protein
MVCGAVNFVLFIDKVSRLRRISEIVEVTGASGGQVTRSRLFATDADGSAVRDPEVPIMRAHLLAAVGYDDASSSTRDQGRCRVVCACGTEGMPTLTVDKDR